MRAAAWAPGLVLGACLLPFVRHSRYNGDEFTVMALAAWVARGAVPYRDFFWLVAPGEFLPLAPLYRLFGPSLLAAHAAMVAIALVTALQLRGVVRRLEAPGWAGWLAAYLFVFVCFVHWPVYSHHWVALPPALAAIACAQRAFRTGGAAPWAGAGALAGLTGLAMQPNGATLGLALAAGLALDAAARRPGWRAFGRRLGALAAGGTAVAGAAIAALWALGAAGAAWADLVVWPLAQYKVAGNMNDHPFASDLPALLAMASSPATWGARAFRVLGTYALFLLPAPVAALALARAPRRRSWGPAEAGLALVAIWAVLGEAVVLRGRADFAHVSVYAVPACALAAAGAAALAARAARGGGRRRAALAAGLAAAPAAALAALALSGALALAGAARKEPALWRGDPDARLLASPALAWLRARARPGDTLAALPEGGLFYVYGPPPAVRHAFMAEPRSHPYYTPAEWEAYWAQVRRARPRFVVLAFSGGESPAVQARYRAMLPPGYRLAATLPAPITAPGEAAIFERAD